MKRPSNEIIEHMLKQYHQLSVTIASLEAKRKKISKGMKDYMAHRNARELFAGGLKALRYPIVKAEWDVDALLDLGLKRSVTLTQVVADEKAIERAVAEGQLTMEEVHACGAVRKSWGFRVDEVG